MTLKSGQPATCGQTKTLEKQCSSGNTAGCKYERKVSDCVDNKKTISFNIVSGGADCPQKEHKEKPCGRGGRNRKEKKAERKARRNEHDNHNRNTKCRYDRESATWSECDPDTNKRMKVMTLKPGQPSSCEQTKTIEKGCRTGRKHRCRYDRKSATWSECDPDTNKRTKVMTLESGQPSDCEMTKRTEKACKTDRGANRKEKCRYDRRSVTWSECESSNQEKNEDRREESSGKKCRYDRRSGTWSTCDPTTNKRMKVMTLKSGQPSSYRGANRKQKCRYDRRSVTWSECDPVTKKKTKVMTLKPGQPSGCEQTKTMEKTCGSRNTAGCKYERQASDCVDNKKTISFNIVSGGADCPRKEPKEKPCGRGGRNRKEKKAERKARRNERRNQRNNGGQS
ncbi:hypothetical protein LSH36_347g04006 [Paralvinella palmiformis]|uniref:Pleiotrophin/Midkine C-terminal domain-containing protein n=1 Tax=Paralvinella palmiformis TaxID=53620 RepID=A0AAD9N1T0_9ANNE|nr:hypothetical protein LSH36_347g04006 [Paralvinella palmiformis]